MEDIQLNLKIRNMDYRKWFVDNAHEVVLMLHKAGYTPHTLVEEANKDGVDVWEYIYLLYNI